MLKRKGATMTTIGNVYMDQGNYSQAINYYFQALEIVERTKDEKEIAHINANIGTFYYSQGDYPRALDYYFKALKINEAVRNKEDMPSILGNIGSVYDDQNDYSKALEYYFKALKMDEELEDRKGIAINLGNIGNIYGEQNDYSKALEYYFKALKIREDIGAKNLIASCLGNIGALYNKQRDYTKALDYNFRARKIANEVGDKSTEAINLAEIGSIYLNARKFLDAEKYLLQALNLSESIGDLSGVMEINQNLSMLYSETNNYKKAVEHYKLAMAAKDSLFSEDKAKEITRKEMNYTFDKKQDSIKAVQDKKDALAKADLEKQKVIRNSIAGGAGILVLSAIISFAFYKRRRDAIEKQKETSFNLQVSETEMKALRSQMNPHFIFNALQSIQTFLLNHKSEEANTYLLKFSKLMRLVLENSRYQEVPLKDDLRALKLYMQLESIRLPHPFTYTIHLDETIDPETTTIPPLILQPFVENAIWHGLRNKNEAGHIDIYISEKDQVLHSVVEDNGVGRNGSKGSEQPIKKESLGVKLTEERLKILNEQKKTKAQFKVIDLFTEENRPAGTRVELSLPLVA